MSLLFLYWLVFVKEASYHLYFSIFIDDLILKAKKSNVGPRCYLSISCVSLVLFAEDILLLLPTIASSQIVFNTCECEPDELDMRVNAAIYISLCVSDLDIGSMLHGSK